MTTVFDYLVGGSLVGSDSPDVVASKSNYGFLAFLVFFGLALALWVISRSLNKHVRKIRFAEREEALAREAQGQTNPPTTT